MTHSMSPSGWHASPDVIRRYVGNDPGMSATALWALEAHLESCARCRAQIPRGATDADALVEQVWVGIEAADLDQPVDYRRRRISTWASPAMVPWLVMTSLVTILAGVLDGVIDGPFPSVLLLFAPVAPVAGVAAAWARGVDPAHELVAATPRAGLYLVLRRTIAVLVVVMPLLTVAGLATGTSPVLFLVPCLTFAVATLALGSVVGVRPAAIALMFGWSAVVIAPSLLTARAPVLLEIEDLPLWAAAAGVAVCVIWLHRTAFTRLQNR